MAKLTKRQKALAGKVETTKLYAVDNALAIVKECAVAKFDESIDVTAGPVDKERHLPASLVPAAEHDIMLPLIGAVPLDQRDEFMVAGGTGFDCLQHAVERGIAAILIVDVDRSQEVEVAIAEPRQHRTELQPRRLPSINL